MSVPATRLVGFTALLLLVYLHNRLVLGSSAWRAYSGVADILIGWALLGFAYVLAGFG